MITKQEREIIMSHLAIAQKNIVQAINYTLKESGFYEEYANKVKKQNKKRSVRNDIKSKNPRRS